MRKLLAVCAFVSMFGLTAARCTPEQVTAVEQAYRAQVAVNPPAGSTQADATCDMLTISADGYPDGSLMYVSVGGTPPLHVPFDGSSSVSMPVAAGFAGGLDHYSYSVTINDALVLPNTDGPVCY